MISQIYALDVALLRLINVQWTHPLIDILMVLVSDFGLFKIPLIIGGVLMLLLGQFRERLFVLCLLLCLGIGDAGINSYIKKTVNRPRPHESVEDIHHVRREGWKVVVEPSHPRPVERGRSMTSGHVCNNVAIGFLLTLIYGGRFRLIWFWVFLVSYSRIYLGVHFPSDAFVSFFVAAAYTLGICFGVQKIWQGLTRKFKPEWLEDRPHLFRWDQINVFSSLKPKKN